MCNNLTILVLEAGQALRLYLLSVLAIMGHTVIGVSTPEAASAELTQQEVDLLLADVDDQAIWLGIHHILADHPQVSLFAFGRPPAAELGINPSHYLQKPFPPRRLIAAITEMTGIEPETLPSKWVVKEGMSPFSLAAPLSGRLCVHLDNGTILDCRSRRLLRPGHVVRLSPTEARILECLLANHGQIVPYEEMVACAQGYRLTAEEASHVLRPVITRLRYKLEQVGGQRWVLNARRRGYMLLIGSISAPVIE